MPATTIYIHKRDRATLKRMQFLPGPVNAHSQFLHIFDAVASLRMNGITWDGANLWLCTEGDTARGLSPKLVQLDPSLTGFVNSPTQVIVTNLPAGSHLRDIAWHGAGFYGIVDTGGGSYWLVDLDPTGSVSRVLSTALLSSARALCWDGAFIYITLAFTVVAFLQEWDPINAVAMKVTILQLGPTAPGTLGPGVLWDGAYFHTKVIGATNIEYQVNWPDPGAAVLQAVHSDATGVGFPALSDEKLTLAWDGAFMWSIADTV